MKSIDCKNYWTISDQNNKIDISIIQKIMHCLPGNWASIAVVGCSGCLSYLSWKPSKTKTIPYIYVDVSKKVFNLFLFVKKNKSEDKFRN